MSDVSFDGCNNSVIHGDYCFSNILYCTDTKNIKLIDPRGSFFTSGIYGHPYYDYAKLLHCLHGEYDYIINNDFKLYHESNLKFYLHVKSSTLLKRLCNYFFSVLKERKIDLNYLILVESSLFLSMASLHYESLERQKALFMKGLMILNEVIGC